MSQWHYRTIDLGTTTTMPNFRVHMIGKVQRRRTVRQIHYISVGSECIDPVLGHVETELFGYCARIPSFLMPVQYLTQPGNLFFIGTGHRSLSIRPLIAPVGTNTQFRFLVHFLRSNLDFQGFTRWSDNRSV